MVFDDEGIASMPRHVRPLSRTQYKYSEDRDDELVRKRLFKKTYVKKGTPNETDNASNPPPLNLPDSDEDDALSYFQKLAEE